ncbi:MAG TPA: SBBP repeat-containing protein [Candidatus Bathyarchaeia archaeon]|nr:SBBP repeat-containing protein [Candidatus Bathyarchaeia archaeon]
MPYYIVLSCGQEVNTSYSFRLNKDSPSVSFSTYLGGNDTDRGFDIALGQDGSYFVTGSTCSANFPVLNAYDITYNGASDSYFGDVFITKFSADGLLLWSTFLGGNKDEVAHSIAVANDGCCYVTGWTDSSDFPIKEAINDNLSGNGDGFVTKFSSSGYLLWSTYLGGCNGDLCRGIALGTDDSCYVVGSTNSSDFPILNAYNSTFSGNYDAFVTKFSPSGSLLWSTFLGGNENDYGYEIAVANDNSCLVTGGTRSVNFPTKDAYDNTLNGQTDVTISKFSSDGELLWSTYLGGNGNEYGSGIALDSDNNCFVTGCTGSNNFPTLNAFNSTYGGLGEAFVLKLSTSGSLLWSTYLGGNEEEYGIGIVVANDDSCYIIGYTFSFDFPMLNAYDNTCNGGYDSYITKFSSSGSILWSTFLGGNSSDAGYGIAINNENNCYVSGSTWSNNFPIIDAFDDVYSGLGDVFITKFNIPQQRVSASDFLGFVLILPILVFIMRKRKK